MHAYARSSNIANKRPAPDSLTEQREGKTMQPPKPTPYQAMANEQRGKQATAEGVNRSAPIQRYTVSRDEQYNISENGQFAVSAAEKYPKHLFIAPGGDPPNTLPGGLNWEEKGQRRIDNNQYTAFKANIDEYAYRTQKNVANEHCGAFARDITKNNLAEKGDDRSVGEAGDVMKYGETSPGMDFGWENHFAAIVKRDNGDHATYETAVGIPDSWVGIYGVNRGQTFKFKTQLANIERMENIPPAIMEGAGPRVKTFWDYVFCRPGRRTDKLIEMGISHEDAEEYRQELLDWRDTGKEPTSTYMQQIIPQLEQELKQTGGS